MKRHVLSAALLIVSAAPAASAQNAASRAVVQGAAAPAETASPRGQRGPLRGFVYSGHLADGEGPLRWADYPVVNHVYSGSPAEAAGLRMGDAIVRINGRDGTETTAYHGPRIGDAWSLVVQRGLEMVEISFVLVEPTWLLSEWTPPADTYAAP